MRKAREKERESEEENLIYLCAAFVASNKLWLIECRLSIVEVRMYEQRCADGSGRVYLLPTLSHSFSRSIDGSTRAS